MADKLTDPSKAAHEIIEVLEDGDAIRNDGVRLQAANKNPWYVLATIYGEQEEGATWPRHNEKLATKNRRAWNGWFCGGLSDEKRAKRAEEIKLNMAELMPLSKEELTEITKRYRERLNNPQAELPDGTADIDFSLVTFSRLLCFDRYAFEGFATFVSSTFGSEARFISATFSGSVDFSSATFNGFAVFLSANLGKFADFSSVIFSGPTSFRFAAFSGYTDFANATFSNDANFSSTTFKSITLFSGAQFSKHVPQFHAAKLYDDTVFAARNQDLSNWPPLKGENVMPAADQKRAYNRLRLFMNKSLQIDEEQFFHRMEMRCKAVLAKWYHKPLYWLFAAFSDYGNSVWRPIAWGALSVVAAAVFMLWWQGVFAFMPQEAGIDWTFGLLGKEDTLAATRKAFGWSVSNTLPFLGSGKYFTGDEFNQDMSAWLKFVGWGQTLFGYILLFFLGLGLRNRFRLR